MFFPSLLPSAIEPVWCPSLGAEEEATLSQAEAQFNNLLDSVRCTPAPKPIGMLGGAEAEEDGAIDDDDEMDDEMDDDEMNDSVISGDDDEEGSDDIGSDAW